MRTREAFERHLAAGCERCARELAETRDTLAALAEGGPSAAPDSSLRNRLFERIRAEQFLFLRSTEGTWTASTDGARQIKDLSPREGNEPYRCAVVRLGGQQSPAVSEGGCEHCYVLSGTLESTGGQWGSDDFFLVDAESAVPRSSTEGATLFIVRGPERIPGSEANQWERGAAWEPLAAGIRWRLLGANRSRDVRLMVIQMDPGSQLPDHEHGGVEELYLAHGSCEAGGRLLEAGDYHRAPAGSAHSVTGSRTGCTMIVLTQPPVAKAA